MPKPVAALVICLIAFAALWLPAGAAGAQTISLHPYCTAEHCPRCPQPLELSSAPQECRDCLNAKLQAINNCSKNRPPATLDRAFIGVWRSAAGLRMRVVQTGRGFIGTLVWAPPKLRGRYPTDGVLIMDAGPGRQGRYAGRLLAPSGKWIRADYVVGSGKEMESKHPGNKSVRWHKTVEMKIQDHRPVPGGPPPPGLPPDRPGGGR